MKTRTWPLGTQYEVKVLKKEVAQEGSIRVHVLFVVCERINEGFILIDATEHQAKPGDEGTITFTAGGPRGAYWKFEPAAVAADRGGHPTWRFEYEVDGKFVPFGMES